MGVSRLVEGRDEEGEEAPAAAGVAAGEGAPGAGGEGSESAPAAGGEGADVTGEPDKPDAPAPPPQADLLAPFPAELMKDPYTVRPFPRFPLFSSLFFFFFFSWRGIS